MAQIGTFTRDEKGTFSGAIRTLTLNTKASIRPSERDNEKAPDHRVYAGAVEIGAGWTKAARESGTEYLSLKLDDRFVARRRSVDGAGRVMPSWPGCIRLRGRQLFLLMDGLDSFDGRYFGVTEAAEIVGKADLIWAP